MDIDDEEDFYSPEGTPEEKKGAKTEQAQAPQPEAESKDAKEDLEEGEEEDEGAEEESDSDIDIITERKDGTKAAPPSSVRSAQVELQ